MVAVRDKIAGIPPLVDYDHLSDVLYVSLGQPVPDEGQDGPRGIVWRYDMKNDQPCGVTVIGFAKNGWNASELSQLIARHINVDYVPVLKAIERATKR